MFTFLRKGISTMLSLFGCLGLEPKAQTLLNELRAEEEERLERLKREYCA
jgi:phage terminase small subunit